MDGLDRDGSGGVGVVGRGGRCARTMDGSEGFALVKDIRKEEGDEAKDDQDDSNGGGIR